MYYFNLQPPSLPQVMSYSNKKNNDDENPKESENENVLYSRVESTYFTYLSTVSASSTRERRSSVLT